MKKIIGLTGSLGSGCTTVARYLEGQGYTRISISNDILSPLAKRLKMPFATRRDKQNFGNEVRKTHKEDYKKALKDKIKKCGEKIIIECFRNPLELE